MAITPEELVEAGRIKVIGDRVIAALKDVDNADIIYVLSVVLNWVITNEPNPARREVLIGAVLKMIRPLSPLEVLETHPFRKRRGGH